MAPRKRVIALVLLLAVLVSGGQAEEAAAPAVTTRGAGDAELGSLARGGSANVVVGDAYIGCLEMRFSRCFADLTVTCIEDAMVDCSLEAAAAATKTGPAAAAATTPAATTTGPAAAATTTTAAAPGGGAAAAELAAAIAAGIVARGLSAVTSMYIDCLEVDLVKCYNDPTLDCVKNAFGAC